MTQWTQTQYKELSKKVAEKFSIEQKDGKFYEEDRRFYSWLHNDWYTIMELCVEHGVDATHSIHFAIGEINCVEAYSAKKGVTVYYADHKNDKSLAERIARMLALMEVQM